MKIFSYESRFSQLLLKLCYACCLNLLWFVCSIPVFTIGAATTALCYASLKIVRDEDSHVFALFFRSFRENFRQATVIWLILLGVGLFLGADVHFAMFFVVVAWFTPLILFGEGFCALVSAWLLNGILISVSGTPEDSQEAHP